MSTRRLLLVMATVAALLCGLAAPAYAGPLRPPSGLTASAVTHTGATISWQAASGATGYDVLRGTQSGGPYALVGRTSGLSYADTGLTPVTTYFYVVRSTAGTKVSQNSAQLTVTTTLTPPTNVRHTAHLDQVDLSWDAAPGALRYSIVRSNEDGSGNVIVGSTTQTSYTDMTVMAYSAYTFWVRAEGGTTSADSAPVHAYAGRPTSTTVTVSPSPSENGQWVLLTATVRPFDPSILRYGGEVVFYLNGEWFGAAWVEDGRGVAEKHWLAGTGQITAQYRGDRSSTQLGSSDAAVSHAVVPRTSPPVSFLPPRSYRYGLDSSPTSSAVADVTGDGRLDALMTTQEHGPTSDTDYKLWIFAQQADGSLAPPQTRVILGAPAAKVRIATGDVDADGDGDVAVTANLGVEVFLQAGGGLAEPILVPVEGGGSDLIKGDVRLADLDADGRADLVSAGVDRVVAFRSMPDGTFGPPVMVEAASREQVEVGDVTGDGRPDIVTRDRYVTVSVHAQTDAGGFVEQWRQAVPTGYMGLVNSIAVEDVSGDGRADLVASVDGNEPGSRLQVYVQAAAGGLTTPVTYPAYDIPEPLALVDVGGDGRRDLVVAHGGWRTFTVMPQRPDGWLGAERFFDLPSYATHFDQRSLSVGDVTGDGRPDVVLAEYIEGLVVVQQA